MSAKLNSSNLNKKFHLAQKYIVNGSLNSAYSICSEILKKYPENIRFKKLLENINKKNNSLFLNFEDPNEQIYSDLLSLFKKNKYYKIIKETSKLLKLFPNSNKILLLRAMSYQSLSKIELALKDYRNVLFRDAKNFYALKNIGLIFFKINKFKESNNFLLQALELQKNNLEINFKLGVCNYNIGNFEEALKYFLASLEFEPYNSNIYCNIGLTYFSKEEYQKAFNNIVKSIKLDNRNNLAYSNLNNILRVIEFKKFDNENSDIVNFILNEKLYVNPQDLSKSVISLIKLHPKVIKIMRDLQDKKLEENLFKNIKDLNTVSILKSYLEISCISDLLLEELLIEIRKIILFNISKIKSNPEVESFLHSLSHQCYINEYIYGITKKENRAIINIEKNISKNIELGRQIPNLHFLILSCYKPLYNYKWKKKIKVSKKLEKIKKIHIDYFLEEKNIKNAIIRDINIKNQVSKKIKSQYEENPYPRWTKLPSFNLNSSIVNFVYNKKLNLNDYRVLNNKSPSVLIAGCGTGQNVFNNAQQFKNSNILGIDLSLSSLAYAIRKSKELKFSNIHFNHLDILNLKKINANFDIVEVMGVLHHMENPMQGLESILNCIKPGGLLRIGLYSKKARENITRIKKDMTKLDIQADKNSMLSFRNKIKKLKINLYDEIFQSNDAYSLSGFRDLIFHEHELYFNLDDIKNFIKKYNLHFCGFDNDELNSKFINMFGFEELQNLDKWANIENNNKKYFSRMYQFWCQKVY